MRHSSPESIGKEVGAVAETTPGPGEGDFLQRVNATITNFKELGKIFMQLKGENEEGKSTSELQRENDARVYPNDAKPRAPGLLDYVQLAIRAGYGDTPIGELIEQMSPYTLKKVMEIFKSAGLKK